jgi:putative endonuclease
MDARHRERSMKRWRRAWKIELIESFNPEWRDLYFDLNN